MERQGNMPQMKEQEKSLEKEWNKMDAHELPDGVFKTMIIRMLKDLRKRIDDLTENLNNEMVGMK